MILASYIKVKLGAICFNSAFLGFRITILFLFNEWKSESLFDDVKSCLYQLIDYIKTTIEVDKDSLELEYLFATQKLIAKIDRQLGGTNYVRNIKTLKHLFLQLFKQESVAFIGEPLNDLQIIGYQYLGGAFGQSSQSYVQEAFIKTHIIGKKPTHQQNFIGGLSGRITSTSSAVASYENIKIDLNLDILPLYKRVITEYEDNTLQVKGNQILINGEVANTYTFKQNYYWMMGDNRHNSIDARAWGFVPYNHVIGKPVFIWMSIDGINDGIKNWKFRWDRIFTTVSGSGKRTSYFIPFIVLIIGITLFNKWRKKKKAKN